MSDPTVAFARIVAEDRFSMWTVTSYSLLPQVRVSLISEASLGWPQWLLCAHAKGYAICRDGHRCILHAKDWAEPQDICEVSQIQQLMVDRLYTQTVWLLLSRIIDMALSEWTPSSAPSPQMVLLVKMQALGKQALGSNWSFLTSVLLALICSSSNVRSSSTAKAGMKIGLLSRDNSISVSRFLVIWCSDRNSKNRQPSARVQRIQPGRVNTTTFRTGTLKFVFGKSKTENQLHGYEHLLSAILYLMQV